MIKNINSGKGIVSAKGHQHKYTTSSRSASNFGFQAAWVGDQAGHPVFPTPGRAWWEWRLGCTGCRCKWIHVDCTESGLCSPAALRPSGWSLASPSELRLPPAETFPTGNLGRGWEQLSHSADILGHLSHSSYTQDTQSTPCQRLFPGLKGSVPLWVLLYIDQNSMQVASTNTSLQMLTPLHLYRFKYSHRSKYLNSPHLWPTDSYFGCDDVWCTNVRFSSSRQKHQNITYFCSSKPLL